MTEYRMTSVASPVLFVSGLVGRDESGGPVVGTVKQTERIFERLVPVLNSAQLELDSVVRLRVYLTDIEDWPRVAEVVSDRFSGSIPPCTVLGVSALVQPWMGIEIDFEAGLSTSL